MASLFDELPDAPEPVRKRRRAPDVGELIDRAVTISTEPPSGSDIA